MTDTRIVRLPVEEPWDPADMSRPHLIGVAGAGMSALARVLVGRRAQVSGSDRHASPRLSALAAAGAAVHVGHNAAHVADASCVIVSTAVREDNVELVAARRQGIPVLHRAQALAQSMADCPGGILVTGTHGKTTVSAMVAHILRQVGEDPTYVIGADWTQPVTGGHAGARRYFVAEADESDRSFRWLRTGLAVLTGIEDDHPEQYPTAGACAGEVALWLRDIPSGGTVVVNADDPLAMRATDNSHARRFTYGGTANADVRILRIGTSGATSRTLARLPGGRMVQILLKVPGRVMAHNAAAALATAVSTGIAAPAAASALASYRPVRRRLTVHGEAGGVTVVDSFAHHPTAISADLQALATVAGHGRVLVVFQPSGFARTRALGERMGAALAAADRVVLLPTVDACDDVPASVPSLAIPVSNRDKRVSFAADSDRALAVVITDARPGDIIVTMGTGTVTELGAQILTELSPLGRPTTEPEPAAHR